MATARLASRAAFLSGFALAALAIVYLMLISGQGQGFSSRVWLVAAWLAVTAVLCLVGATVAAPRIRALVVGVAACALVPLGVAALWSFGFVVLVIALVAGGAASIAAYEAGIGAWWRFAAAVLLVVTASGLLYLGFSVTE